MTAVSHPLLLKSELLLSTFLGRSLTWGSTFSWRRRPGMTLRHRGRWMPRGLGFSCAFERASWRERASRRALGRALGRRAALRGGRAPSRGTAQRRARTWRSRPISRARRSRRRPGDRWRPRPERESLRRCPSRAPVRRRCPSNAPPRSGGRSSRGRLFGFTTDVVLSVVTSLRSTVALLTSAREVALRGVPQIRVRTFRVAVREAMIMRHLVSEAREVFNTFVEDVLKDVLGQVPRHRRQHILPGTEEALQI